MPLGPYLPLYYWAEPAYQSSLLSSIIRNNLGWIAQTFITTDATLPVNPRDGMPRILADDLTNVKLQYWLNGAWMTVFQHLELGIPAPFKMVFSFAVAAVVWTVDHNLGTQVLVQCWDSTWNLIQPSNIQQIAPAFNRVVVTHALAEAGYVTLIG